MIPRRLALTAFALLLVIQASRGQFKQSVDRDILIAQELAGCLKGYAGVISGDVINYPRMREDRMEALLTRATTGMMIIEWRSQPVPSTLKDTMVCFVVHAGMMTRPNTVFKFRFFVNDSLRCVFSSLDSLSWEVGDSCGVRLAFDGMMRDQNGDTFGYLRIAVPARYLVPGEPARFKAVGDSAGSSVWFMVFKDPDVLDYLKDKITNETYCSLSFAPQGTQYAMTVDAPASWNGRQLACAVNDAPPKSVLITPHAGGVEGVIALTVKKSDRFRLILDGEPIVDLYGIFGTVNESRILPKRLLSLKSRSLSSGSWMVDYQSFFSPALGSSLAGLTDLNGGANNLDLILSTHQDIAWMDSPERCVRDRDEKILTPALAIMNEDSTYHFDLEDVLFLREYLDRHPDRKETLRKYLSNGQLGIGASYTQPYEDLCSAEMLVRQFYAGRKWLRKNFPGCDSRTYWNADVPGRSLQMPQVLKKAGVNSMFISRFGTGLYNWLSPDSSAVLTFSPGHYGDFAERVGHKGFPEIAGYLVSFTQNWRSVLKDEVRTVPIVSMSDMSTPVRYGDFMDKWNGLKSIELPGAAPRAISMPLLRPASMGQFFEAVAKENPLLPVVKGERPDIWLYIHGPTHHWAISAKREADFYLPAAEVFSSIDALLGKSFTGYPQRDLTSAWESQIYPDHGWGGKNGEITDSTFRAKYEYARNTAKRICAQSTGSIASRIRTAPAKGIPVVVFNALSWKRSAPVRFTATFSPGMYRKGFAVHDASGRALPTQMLAFERYTDGSVKSAEMLFVAEDVSPIGYATFYVRPSPRAALPDTTSLATGILQNRFYRITLGRGGVTQIVDVEMQKELLSTEKFLGGELFTMQSVGEDAGEWSTPQQPTMEGFDKLSNYKPAWTLVESGPVRQVVETQQDIGHANVIQRVVIYSALKQVDFETSLRKWDGTKYREFRLAFPVKMQKGQVTYEVPFGAVEVGNDEMKGAAGERYLTEASALHPRSIQNWINVSDGDFGVTFSSSVAVWDYLDPTDQTMSTPLLQPVLLASRRSCHGEGPWYLQAGDHEFRFSLTSHRSGWRNGRRFGVGANAPLTAVYNPVPAAKPTLAEEKSFFSVSADNVVLSTMKKCEDDDRIILRLYEDSGKDVSARLRFATPIQNAWMTNILEEEGKPTPFKLDELAFGLTHSSIQTFKINPKLQ